jgi:hypothetical protein
MTKTATNRLQHAYARRLGALAKLEREAARLRREMDTLEQAILLFDPEWSPADIRPVQPKRASIWGGRGKGMRAVWEVLKEAEQPLTVREIATLALQRRGIPVPCPSEFDPVLATITGALNKRNGAGLVRHDDKPKRWSLARS